MRNKKRKRKINKCELHRLQVERAKLEEWIKQSHARSIIEFEGRDTAGT